MRLPNFEFKTENDTLIEEYNINSFTKTRNIILKNNTAIISKTRQ